VSAENQDKKLFHIVLFDFKQQTYHFQNVHQRPMLIFKLFHYFTKNFQNLDVSPFMSQCIKARNGLKA